MVKIGSSHVKLASLYQSHPKVFRADVAIAPGYQQKVRLNKALSHPHMEVACIAFRVRLPHFVDGE
ncbi:MAG TPA: hypothetical protein V6D12_13440 [Candidatus Obscuribacterales bacterium]